MCQVNNEKERNILGEEEDQIGREPIRRRRRRRKKKSQFARNRKEKKKKTVRWKEKGKGREGNRRFSQCFNSRSSIVRELKLVHATRATCGYRNPNFSSKLQEVGVFSYIGSSLFKSYKWSCGSAQTQN